MRRESHVRPSLHVVMYHYIRDFPKTEFPKINGMPLGDFQKQLALIRANFEMASLESAIQFLQGAYTPSRDMFLLTFDDGLKEHYSTITPLLVDYGVQGFFFPITFCIEDGRVAPVHMNHFLMATLGLNSYQTAFLQRLRDFSPHHTALVDVDCGLAQRTYRWDTSEVACFKYLLNFLIETPIRDELVKALFEEYIGEEKSFSRLLYFSWQDARQMQEAGMIIGGHSHQHRSLATLSEEELSSDLSTSTELLLKYLQPSHPLPFSYPYGKKNSFSDAVAQFLKRLGFICAFSTEIGQNDPGIDLFALRRIDCKEAPSASN
jgi:peptidoglycan/xylan/chitin deacetylase (PgdA/CDA1 family)